MRTRSGLRQQVSPESCLTLTDSVEFLVFASSWLLVTVIKSTRGTGSLYNVDAGLLNNRRFSDDSDDSLSSINQ